MKVLVTGGAGYIGSHAVRELILAGHQVIVLDDLSQGHRRAVHTDAIFIRGSTSNPEMLARTMSLYGIEAVMHFAAHIEVAESVAHPKKYYQNNLCNTLNLLQAMVDLKIRKLVFSSTAAVYGEPQTELLEEDHPRSPLNPYGRSKMMSEMVIEDFCKSYAMQATVLRYFNVAGATPSAVIGEDHRPETHLIPKILKAALTSNPEVKIYGTDYPTFDGTCVRDYVHVVDLARAHVCALEGLNNGISGTFNIGSEKGFSVRQVIQSCEKITGKKLIVKEEGRRPGDPAILIASSQKTEKVLGWERLYPDLDTIIKHAWQWHSSHPEGYADILPEQEFQFYQISN